VLIGCCRRRHLKGIKKSAAGLRELPARLIPQDVSRTKDVKIGSALRQASHASRPLWNAQERDISFKIGDRRAPVRLARQNL
jgi:hypothetical protein